MIPVLFPPDATTFTTQGLGALSDVLECYVEEERNGEYEGYLKYPITGIHYEDIGLRYIIVAKPNDTDDPQPFRIYNVSKPLNGIVTVRFQHLIYDLSGYPASPFAAATLSAALTGLISNCPVSCPFTLSSSRSVTATFRADVPASIRSWMGGKQGSLLDIYGGEWHYDKYTATLPTSRGANRGVVIRYGKNLLNLQQEENCAALYTGVYPYWVDMFEGTLVTLTQKVVNNTETPTYSGATYDYDRILPLDLSYRWSEPPTQTQLKDAAKAYIEANLIGTPKVNLTVDFLQYTESNAPEQVRLCDTVTIEFPRMHISATAKCIKTKWNVLLDRYDELKLGDARTTIADTIAATKGTADATAGKTSAESTQLERVVYYESGKAVLDVDIIKNAELTEGAKIDSSVTNPLEINAQEGSSGTSKIVYIPNYSYAQMGLPAASPSEDFIKALIQKVCADYPGRTITMFTGVVTPGSRSFVNLFIYDTDMTDSQTGLPQYAYGEYYGYANNVLYRFRVNEYSFKMAMLQEGGNVVEGTSSVTSLASGTTTNIASVSLTAGTWLVTGQFNCPVASADSFRVYASITTTSGSLTYGAYTNHTVLGSAQSSYATNLSRIIEVTGTTTVYLVANQNSGAAKTLTTSRNLIRAVRIT